MARKQLIWKPKLFRLGLLLTILVIVADWGQLLNALENQLYDRRAKYCRLFTPPPTDRIVHIDIDDDSLGEIGKWPWRRETLAKVVDEIALAKPKVIGMDMYFPEPEKDEGVVQPDGSVKLIAHDDLFADSLKRAGNVLLPISVRFQGVEVPDPLLLRVQTLLESDLEMDPAELLEKLQQRGESGADLAQNVRRVLPLARKAAIMNRLNIEFSKGDFDLESLRKKLVPRSVEADVRVRSESAKQLGILYTEVLTIRATERFRFPLPKDVPLCDAPGENAVNTLKFAEVIRYSGFVDLPPSTNDGTVRTVPLLVNYRGSAFPHMALSMACALLDLDPSEIRCTPDRIILPIKNGAPIEIPARSETSTTLGVVGAMVDVPYFGKAGADGWLTMYDYPRFQEPASHLKIGQFWAMIERSDSVKKNNGIVDGCLKELSGALLSPEVDKYIAAIPDLADTAARLNIIDITIKQIKELAPELLTSPDKDLDPQIRPLGQPAKTLVTAARENRITQELLLKDRIGLTRQLQGRAVFVDWTATGGGDRYPTSLHPNCPGSLIQSTILNGILTRDLWRRLPHSITALLTLAVGIVTTILVALLPPWRALISTVLVMASYALFSGEILFDYRNLIVGAAGPLSTCALVWMGLTLTHFITEAKQRLEIRRRFSSYVDPALVDYVEEHPELISLAGERRDMTVVFTDLAGFTTISEKLGEETVPLLNAYFGAMVPLIRKNQGYVNKFLGDGIMFFYGAPRENLNHAVDAVQTVIEMRKALIPFNEELKQRNLPFVGMRAGMTTGEMLVGDAGSRSDDERHTASDYTVLGDKVNLAARLESANKFFGSNLLMNQRTRDLIGERFLIRPIGKIIVAGKSEDVMTYEAICKLGEATAEQLLHVELSVQVVEAFQASEFDDCLLLCEELELRTGDAKFAATYRKLCTKHLSAGFEGDFSGQIVLSEK